MPTPTPYFRFCGILNSQEIVVAEAIQARAWEALQHDERPGDEMAARVRLSGIVVRLMSDRSKSISDLATAAVSAFRSDIASAD